MTPPLHMFALQGKGSIIIIDKLLSGCHKVFLTFFYNSRWDKRLPVFRRSTMKVPTFSNFPHTFQIAIYLNNLDFTGKFNVPTGHFFIKKIFDMLYNNSTT